MIKDLKGGNDMKITMKTPLVEMDGDEMTRVIWAKIKEILLEPHIDLKTEYYDLGLKKRDETDDRIKWRPRRRQKYMVWRSNAPR